MVIRFDAILYSFSILWFGWCISSTSLAGDKAVPAAKDASGHASKSIVAVQDVCAWPNLTMLHDGTIIATIHNQPSHLQRPADVDCWASRDNGKTWTKVGTPAPRDNETVARGNVAVGTASNGDLVVIASGWDNPSPQTRGTILPPIVSRSSDGGKTWKIDTNGFPGDWPETARRKNSPEGFLVPFGDILPGNDGSLRVCMYTSPRGATRIYRSDDDGRTWTDPVQIDSNGSILEPAFLHLGNGKWLLASRLKGLELYTSEDDGRTWSKGERISPPNAHPGHLLLLNDGRIVLTYGNRNNPKGVDARISTDQGQTWSEPRRVSNFSGDGGYPASVELDDGQILTAYYAKEAPGHHGYHMGVATWSPDKSWDDQ